MKFTEKNQCVQVTTPFLDRHNDYLQIYIREEKDGFFLTDGGYMLNDLATFDFTCPKQQELLQTILNDFGVQREEDQLVVTSTLAELPQQQQSLVQAMLAVEAFFR
jgi:hypothetical protein